MSRSYTIFLQELLRLARTAIGRWVDRDLSLFFREEALGLMVQLSDVMREGSA
jgi:hypothetical protein